MTSLRYLLLAVLVPALDWAPAADRYVSPSGNDAAAGTLAAPWKTLGHAASQLVAGDTLFLRGGIYAERLLLSGKSGTVDEPIVIRAYDGEMPLIDGASLTVATGGRVGLVELVDCSHIEIHGIEIRNFTSSAAARTPVGILIEGSGSGLKILGNQHRARTHHGRIRQKPGQDAILQGLQQYVVSQ